jgi:hypothetical protein
MLHYFLNLGVTLVMEIISISNNEFIMDSLSLSSITSFVKPKACINAVVTVSK